MMPVYMDSSQPRQMIPPQGCYHQGYGNSPHHMPMDAPPQCYGSCAHCNFPVYWTTCYSPQLVPYHPHCMNHSGFHPHAPPFPCYTQPPFPVSGHQPWYDSQKDISGKHRCGNCSPQVCNPKNDRGVVIEEHEPEIEKQNQGEAVPPVRSTNFPYPIIWIPRDNAQNQDHGGSVGSGNHEHPPTEVKAPESMAVQKSVPKSWNCRFPFDESTIKPLVQNQDRQKAQNGKNIEIPFDINKLKSLLQGQDVNEKNKEELGQLPYPVFWIPSHGKREEVKASESKESSDEARNCMSFPSDLHLTDGQKTQNEGKEGNIECKVLSNAEEKTSMRNIPVENNPQEPRNIPVKLLENHMPKLKEPVKAVAKNVSAENTKKERSSSSPKASRLPPVCLRVDPLPKKKNCGSKSPSPPRRKEESLTSEESKPSSILRSVEAERKTVPEACNVKCEEISEDKKMSAGCLDATGTEKESAERNSNLLEELNCEIARPCETKERREKPGKNTLTEEEAASKIQSRFRGYDVRRWEPLKKLKEIATVREQMSDVIKRIQVLEVSTHQHIEEKEVIVLGETVMNLLLKLDSVQGLHPSIRDYRKSLARELSDIQEKLDSLGKRSVIAEEEAVKVQMETTSQTSYPPVNWEHSQPAEENKVVFDSDTEKVLHPSLKEHPLSLVSVTDEQLAADAEEGTGFSETLATDLKPVSDTGIYEVAPTSITEKITSQTSDCPLNSDDSQLAEEKQMVSELDTENRIPSSEEHPVSILNTTDELSAADAEVGPGLFEVLATQPEPATETSKTDAVATLTSVPEKLGEVETVLPINAPSADENGMRVTNSEEDKAVERGLEEPSHKLVQVVETTCGEGLNASEVSEAKANASEIEDRKEDNVTILAAEKDIELAELPVGVIDDETQEKDIELSELHVGVIDDETQFLSQYSSGCAIKTEMTVMDPETASQEETGIEHSSGNDEGIGQETYEEQEEKEQSPETDVIVKEQPRETEVTEHEISEETKKLMEENQRFKETMEELVKAGREQLEVISKLTGRVKSLEKKLSHKKRTQVRRRKASRATKSMSENSTDVVI